MKSLILVLLLAALPLRAEPRRIAVVVGANRGALGRSQLRYSYSDADQIAAVLQQVGQFAAGDVHVLQDPEPQAVLDELDRELSVLRLSGGESLLVFYYSGHADAQALYPDGKPLPFAQLRERLESQAATVRIGIIDACSGGGWTGAKGIYPTAPFVVDVPLQLTSEGSVLIASSSGVEKAHESEQVYGSFFTHHLVAALRGAADQHGEGVVTLTDAFAYARERTIRDSAAVADPQHPSFSMNLRGRSDLPLTRVAQSNTLVELSETEGPLQLIHLGSGLVVMEVPAGKRIIKLSVPAGRYLVRKQRPGGNYSREVTVEPDRSVTVDEADLTLSAFPREAAKGIEASPGGWPIAVNDRPLALYAGMTELQLSLGGSQSYQSSVDLSGGSGVTTERFDLFSIAPAIRYGVTDRLTLTLGGTGTRLFCAPMMRGCATNGYSASAAGLYLLHQGDVDVAATADVAWAPAHAGVATDYSGAGGLTARLGRGLPISLQLTGTLDHDFTVSASSWDLAGVLLVQPLERLSFDITASIGGRLSGGSTLSNPTFGATVTLGSRFDLRAILSTGSVTAATNTFGGTSFFETSSGTSFGLLLALRP